jgi:hypothetical protein
MSEEYQVGLDFLEKVFGIRVEESEEDMIRARNRSGRGTGIHRCLLGDESITTLPCQVALENYMSCGVTQVNSYESLLGGLK